MDHCTKKTPSPKTTAICHCERSLTLFRDDQLHYYYENWKQLKKMMYFLKKLAIYFQWRQKLKEETLNLRLNKMSELIHSAKGVQQ